MKLEEIKPGVTINGIDPAGPVRVVSVDPTSTDSFTVYYKLSTGEVRERMLFRQDEQTLTAEQPGRPWSFDADGDDYKLVLEALRINLAHLFDPMMAVHTSNVEPLPHQISAVYEAMLPKQPLKYVLADDPGAGKTVMAGLFIRELVMRADARRILVVAPGGLVEQWQDEMIEKFGVNFEIFSREMIQNAHSGNPFDERELLIIRLDQLSRDEELQQKLQSARKWDLVIVDEAHKMSATWYGSKLDPTKRFRLGQILSAHTRHLLLMTATPHNGKEEDFQTFLSLLDSDRFYGKFRDGGHKVDVSDVMRRMVKEDLLKFDGTRLFPERRAYTVKYELSALEYELYSAVTDYVKDEMNKADRLTDQGRKGTVGFALTCLQRRLASSPEAIYQSLQRRHKRLQDRLELEKNPNAKAGLPLPPKIEDLLSDDDDEFPSRDDENETDEVVSQATAAKTIKELQAEIEILKELIQKAEKVRHSGKDKKWEELSRHFQTDAEMKDVARKRKMIVFTEHRDTLNYLVEKIQGVLGNANSVACIHGGTPREDRRKIQELFRNDKDVRVLVATDAAGEGVNLQNANLMVNYDLPWNPNRIEQRFGRIHRIGQTEVCHLWNLVALGTRESTVLELLCDKLKTESDALNGKVFNVLGAAFEGESLKDLLIQAIRYGDDPARKAELQQKVESKMDHAHLQELLRRTALCEEVMDLRKLFAVKEEMEKAEARKLQPHFVKAFFSKAFQALGGELKPRENGRFEISHVPAVIRERDRQLLGKDRRNVNPITPKYERVCFEKQFIQCAMKPMASLIHPGHPLMQSITSLILERLKDKLQKGAVLVDATDSGKEPKVLVALEHTVKEGANPDMPVSRRLQFAYMDAQHRVSNAGWAPHLDLRPLSPEELRLAQKIIQSPAFGTDIEQATLAYAASSLVPAHFAEIRSRRQEMVDKNLAAVRERLTKEISYWSDKDFRLTEAQADGKDVRLQRENIRRTIDELSARLNSRTKELEGMRNVVAGAPVIIGAALVIPQGLLNDLTGNTSVSDDTAARKHVEELAMKAVIAAEQAKGFDTVDVSAEKCGWDVTARSKPGVLPEIVRHIEVKGRMKDARTITVTRNEIMYALNQTDKFRLAVVTVDGEVVDGPYYIERPFTQEPDWAVTSVNIDLSQLLSRATKEHR